MATCLVGTRQLFWSRAPVGLHVGQLLSGGLGSPSLFRALLCPQGPGARPTSAHTPSWAGTASNLSPPGERSRDQSQRWCPSRPSAWRWRVSVAHGASHTMLSPAGSDGEQCGPLSPRTCQATTGSPGERCPLCVSPQVSEGSTGVGRPQSSMRPDDSCVSTYCVAVPGGWGGVFRVKGGRHLNLRPRSIASQQIWPILRDEPRPRVTRHPFGPGWRGA